MLNEEKNVKPTTEAAGRRGFTLLCCSFCYEDADSLEVLIAAADGVNICNNCVDKCNEYIAEFRAKKENDNGKEKNDTEESAAIKL